jgi:exodeoxyribonuclease VII small subunit
MSDERSTFEVTRARLEDIVGQVRRKDVSLEQSLDLLEEAVRLVNQCNELIDQTAFKASAASEDEEPQPDAADDADREEVSSAPASADETVSAEAGDTAGDEASGDAPDANGIEDDERS